MGAASLHHWVVLALAAAIWIVPLWKLLERTGRRGAWALLALFPLAGLVILWVVAFGTWKAPAPGSEPS